MRERVTRLRSLSDNVKCRAVKRVSAEEFLLTTRMQISKTTSVAGAFKMRSVLNRYVLSTAKGKATVWVQSCSQLTLKIKAIVTRGIVNDIVVLLAMSCLNVCWTMLIEF